jgi:hypothetical protein
MASKISMYGRSMQTSGENTHTILSDTRKQTLAGQSLAAVATSDSLADM